MTFAWGDFESFAGVKNKVIMLYFEGQLSLEDEEKLTCMRVGMTRLAGVGRHEFFDDAEFGCLDEVPTITVSSLWASPLVMFGGFCADDLFWHLGFRLSELDYDLS
jgi:hypothetical protein